MKRGLKFVTILAVIICALVIGAISVYVVYFAPNNTIVEAFDEGKLNLVIGDNIIEDGMPAVKNGEVLLPFDIIKKYIDPYIYMDEELKKVIVTTYEKVIRMKLDSNEALINNKPVKLENPVIEENKSVYIPLNFLDEYYNIDVNYVEGKNVIIIDKKGTNTKMAEPVSKKAAIRKGESIKFPIYQKFNLEEESLNRMVVFGDNGEWLKVRSRDGIIGFIEKKYVKVTEQKIDSAEGTAGIKELWKPQKGKINVVWDAIYKNNTTGWTNKDRIEGLDVVSPTWFEVKDAKGTMVNRASLPYVEWAHKNNYKVWAHLSNNLGGPDNTGVFLNNTDAREIVINKVLEYSSQYKLDGINIDFEDINLKDKDALTQFVRELSPLLREKGLVVSMDITPVSTNENWSLCYDRKVLGETVDYIMLMAYDQHWAGSPKAGSVAQLSWVEESIKRTLDFIPKEKLLLGLPYYTRVWITENDKLRSVAVSMGYAKSLIKENNAQVKWDEESGQFYAEYNKKNGSNNKIWLESEESIDLKSSLVHKYDLAGAAGWRKDFEESSIWNILDKNLKNIDSYEAWQSQNKDKKYVYND
ncbi:MAG TPA: glycosyl hydrolase family 18 protein [Pseudobacteroides sp.]|nr:glycosyl hydrolase family 18 protein [Pseudobacteroides sp.]